MNDHSLKPGEVALFNETTFGAEILKFKNHLNTLLISDKIQTKYQKPQHFSFSEIMVLVD